MCVCVWSWKESAKDMYLCTCVGVRVFLWQSTWIKNEIPWEECAWLQVLEKEKCVCVCEWVSLCGWVGVGVWVNEWVSVHMRMSKVRLREDGARERFREIMRMFFAWVAKQDECFPRACLRKKRIIRERDKDRFFEISNPTFSKRSNPGLSRWPQRQIRHRILRR